MQEIIFPDTTWESVSPSDAGFDPIKLDSAKRWLDDNAGDLPYRIVIVRGGRIVAQWKRDMGWAAHLNLASAAKSIFSCVLGIAVADGKISSVDDKIKNYYPEALDIGEGTGPKLGRYAFAPNQDITLRHLISNTSGYMKPDESPGQIFHYQTYGMNILTHAIAKVYGLYDSNKPQESPALRPLIEKWIAKPIGAEWSYRQRNFNLPTTARINVFGYYNSVYSTAHDMARLGWLWCNWGQWQGQQIVPENWMREATQVAPDIHANCSQEQWVYGHGFWVNQYGQLWSQLPHDSFAAAGAGRQRTWVCPSLNLVVAQSPGIFQSDNDSGLLQQILEAVL